MTKQQLIEILKQYYTLSGYSAVLRGTRRPKYNLMYTLYKTHAIPFEAWNDLSEFLTDVSRK